MLKKLVWTKEVTHKFWSDIADTDFLERASFSNSAALYLIDLVRPFLKTDGLHLDFGAGEGYLTGTLLRAGFATAAYEPSASIDSLISKYVEHPLFLGAINQDTQIKFDVLLMVETIEHLLDEDFHSTLNTVSGLITEGGSLIVTTPNSENLESAMRYCATCEHLFHPWGHVRRFTRESLSATLSQFGFECVVIHEFDFSDAPMTIWQRQIRELEAIKLSNLVEEIFQKESSNPEVLGNRVKELLCQQQSQREEYIHSAYQTDLFLGTRANLIYVGRKLSQTMKPNVPLLKVNSSPANHNVPSSVNSSDEVLLELHKQLVQAYLDVNSLFQEYESVYWSKLQDLLSTNVLANAIEAICDELEKHRVLLAQGAEKYQEAYRLFLQRLRENPLQSQEHLWPIYVRSLKACTPSSWLYSQNSRPKKHETIMYLLRERLSHSPEALKLCNQVFEHNVAESESINQTYWELLSALYRALQSPLGKRPDILGQYCTFLENQLGESRIVKTIAELQQSQQKLAETKAAQLTTQSELQQSQQELIETKAAQLTTQSELQQSQQELIETKAALLTTQTELQRSEQELAGTKASLFANQSELQQSQQELTETKTALLATQTELQQSQQELAETKAALLANQSELQQSQQELTETKASLVATQSELQQSQQGLIETKAALLTTQTELSHYQRSRVARLFRKLSN